MHFAFFIILLQTAASQSLSQLRPNLRPLSSDGSHGDFCNDDKDCGAGLFCIPVVKQPRGLFGRLFPNIIGFIQKSLGVTENTRSTVCTRVGHEQQHTTEAQLKEKTPRNTRNTDYAGSVTYPQIICQHFQTFVALHSRVIIGTDNSLFSLNPPDIDENLVTTVRESRSGKVVWRCIDRV